MVLNRVFSVLVIIFLLFSSLTVLASVSPNSQLSAKSSYQINSGSSDQAFQPPYTSNYLVSLPKNTESFSSYPTTIGGGSFFVQNISCTYETCYSNYNPYNRDIYTVAAGIGELLMINSSNEIQQKITSVQLKFITFDPQNGNVYATNCLNNEVCIYSPSLSLLHRIPVSSGPTGIVFDPVNGYVFVSHYQNPQINVIASNGTFVTNLSLPNGFSDEFSQNIYDPLNKEVYIAENQSVGVGLIAGINSSVAINISIPLNFEPSGLTVDTSNGYLYIGSADSKEAIALNQSGSLEDCIPLNSCPSSTIFDPYNNYTYFTTYCGNVAVINQTYNMIAYPYVGVFPKGIGYSPVTNDLYISNGGSSNYRIIVASSNAYYSAYEVNFTNANLPSGTEWYVNLSNGQSFSSNNRSITFYEPNGTYSYMISSSNKIYAPSNITGRLTVYGSPKNISVSFSLVTYTIKVNERNLPGGTAWYIGVDSTYAAYSTSNLIKLSEPNGSYIINASSTDLYDTYFPLYTVTVNGENASLIINFTIRPQVGNIKLPPASPNSFAYDTQNHYTYVAEDAYSSVLVMDNNTLITNISINASISRFCGMAYDPIRNLVFVSNFDNNSIIEINATDNSVQKYFTNITCPLGLIFDPANQNIYGATFNGIVVCISGTTLSENAIRTDTSNSAIAYDPLNNNIYVTNTCYGNLSIISNKSKLIGSVTVGSSPTSLLFDPHNGYLYVENFRSGNISVLNSSDKAVASIKVSNLICGPVSQMVYDPFNYNIYLLHSNGQVSVLFNDTCIGEFQAGNYPIYTIYNPSSKEVCVLNHNSNNITQITSKAYTTLYNGVMKVIDLPAGTEWYLNLSNGCDLSSSSDELAFHVPAGTYNFTIQSKISHTYYGKLNVTVSFSMNVTLSLYTYPVTIEESGLPSGTTWFVNLSNGTHLSSTKSTITFQGTAETEYNYTVSTSDFLFKPSHASGSFMVNTSEVSIKTDFSEYIFVVIIKETGLIAGSLWYLNVSGLPTIHTTSSSVTIYLQNGNYTLAASSPSFKNITLDFTIDNFNLTKTIAFEPVSKSSPPPVAPKTTSSAYLYSIIAVVSIVVIAALVLLIRKRAGK